MKGDTSALPVQHQDDNKGDNYEHDYGRDYSDHHCLVSLSLLAVEIRVVSWRVDIHSDAVCELGS